MILRCGTLESVVRYLSSFGDSDSVVTITPRRERGFTACIEGRHGSAQYESSCVEALDARFSISLGNLARVSEFSSDCGDFVEITRGSRIKVVPDTLDREWWIEYAEGYSEMPRIKQEDFFEWGSDFSGILESVSHACRDSHDNGSFDCVHIESNSTYSSMVATDGCLIIAHDQRWRLSEEDDTEDIEDSSISLLVPKSTIPGVIATCESMMPVKIHIGQTMVKYRCGNRTAVFPKKRGSFPKWRNAVRDGTKGRVHGFFGVYCDLVEDPVRVSRLFGDICQLKTDPMGVALECSSEDGDVRVVMDAEWGGDIESLAIDSKYLDKIARAWCEEDFKISYRGEDRPLEIGSVFHLSPMTALVMPAVERTVEDGQGSDAA